MNRLLAALPLLAAAACGSEPDVRMENASIEEVAREMRQAGTAETLKPGKWQHKITLLEFDIPGMPPEARSMMQNAMDRVQQYEHCLTPEQAAKPSEDFFTQANQDCRFDHYQWSGGKIDMKMSCSTPQGRMTMVQTGQYRPDGFSTSMTQVIDGGPGGKGMTIKAEVVGTRVGDCDGTEKAQLGN